MAKINDVELEINCYDDKALRMLDKARLQEWEGLNLPVLPLPYAAVFYKTIGKKSKTQLIKSSLNYTKQIKMKTDISKQRFATIKTSQLKGLINTLASATYDQGKHKEALTNVISDLVETMLLDGDDFKNKIERSEQLNSIYLEEKR